MPSLKRAVGLVWRSAPRCAIAKLILMVVQGALPLAGLYLTKLIVDQVATALRQPQPTHAFLPILVLLGLTGLVTLLGTVASSLSTYVDTVQGMRVTEYMETLLHTKAIELDLEYYENAQYYDILQRAQEEAPTRPTQVVHRLTQMGQSTVVLLAMLGVLLAYHWAIALLLFAIAIPTALVQVHYAQRMYRWRRDRTPVRRRTNYYSSLLTKEEAAKEIRLFSLGNLFRRRVHHLRRQLHRERLDITTRQLWATTATQAITAIALLLAYGLMVYRTLQGQITLGDLVLYHQAFKRGQTAFQGVLSGWSNLQAESLFLGDLYEFLDLQPKVVRPAQPPPIAEPMQQGIAFEGVSFNYAGSPRQALREINLRLRPGEVIALVGTNGSGKTTLVKLLCRLYEPTSGRITIDGVDLKAFAIADLRQQISVVFQDYVKYHLTAEDNIWLGNVALSKTDPRVRQAAMQTGADQVIDTLPQAAKTILGKLFNRGEELSLGQWQKIALARAFVRNAQVIVLDEPTSALDPQAEADVFEQFRQLIRGQSAILISHRLSTVKMADRIYVMAQGRIVEEGSHTDLLRQGGTYAQLFEIQARNYR